MKKPPFATQIKAVLSDGYKVALLAGDNILYQTL